MYLICFTSNLDTDLIEYRFLLILGEPGSTPYNNLYVNTEIEKHEQNSDLDSSSSSTSSAFSDASSSASTASTEDIQFKQDLINPVDTSVTHQMLNNHEATAELSLPENSVSVEGVDATHEPSDNEIAIDQDEMLAINDSQRVINHLEPTISTERCWLGKEAPLWIPDAEATSCLHCDMRFTMLKRRHHCRACGLVRITLIFSPKLSI